MSEPATKSIIGSITRACPLGIVSLCCAASVIAQTRIDQPLEAPPKSYSDVRWSRVALRASPRIADACRSVERRNDSTYVRFRGTVQNVGSSGKRVRIDFADGSELTFTPTPHTMLYIHGKRTPFVVLEEGIKLDFFIPKTRFQAELQPDPRRLSFVVLPIDTTAD